MKKPWATVLVIDDDHDMAELIACFLSAEHFRPVIALNGPDGLAHARLLQPAAVICDSCMPGMDGLEVIETLRHDPTTTHIPILLMSGHGPGRFDGSGANAFLPKPIRVDEMLALIRSLTTAKQTEPALAGRSEAATVSNSFELNCSERYSL